MLAAWWQLLVVNTQSAAGTRRGTDGRDGSKAWRVTALEDVTTRFCCCFWSRLHTNYTEIPPICFWFPLTPASGWRSGPVRLGPVRLGPVRLAQVQLGDVGRAEGAQVQAALMLVDLADVGRHGAARVVEAPHAHAAIMQLHHQAVAREEPHQNLLAEELGGGGIVTALHRPMVSEDTWWSL
ncbi:hypothetical protein EYF80_063089 [Liparis tanakae]|uniref:Secreted protein n=1 Tax=Liparis tanakae TaxID=230148 RepID=A0A4Z2EDG0_9TELE|nr:hypothetical protein EYF80_063089 [Liparis tanakae]